MNNQDVKIKKAFELFNNKKFEDSKLIFLDLIKNQQFDKKIYYMLYEIYLQLNDNKNAKKYLISFLKFDNKNYVALNQLANLYLKEGTIKLAEENYIKAINLKKDYLIAITNLAVLYQGIGDKDNAEKYYLEGINLSPYDLSIYYNLSRVSPNLINDKKIEFISKVLKKKKLESFNMAAGFFLLAEDNKRKKNIEEEIKSLKLAHKYAFEDKINTNQQSKNYWFNIIPKNYKNINFQFEKDINENLKNLEPIFIVGLPRSGSTVVEAILSSGKKKISNLGETNLINWSVITTPNKTMSLLNAKLICNKLEMKLDNLGVSNLKDNIFIEKSLENFFYIELILKIFPKAKFINTYRNVSDNVFAIFQQFLSKISWSHSLEDILEYTNNYLTVINFFKKKYPNKILSVKLEDLTSNREELAKNIYKFCGLEWDKKALEFYKRKDLFSSTASNLQIRNRLHNHDKNKYKPYYYLLKNFKDKYEWLNQ
ncbi:sulfotransferase [Candidatus Pelagibacter bacterium]|nr:sulfotransferase [Candidatus Pelagibacter bacterium]MDB2693368.1 sulfotransferase [Candidatus Pelagibacter bacterium]